MIVETLLGHLAVRFSLPERARSGRENRTARCPRRVSTIMSTVRLEVVSNQTKSDMIPLQPASQDIWEKKYRLTTKAGEALDADIDGTYLRVATRR